MTTIAGLVAEWERTLTETDGVGDEPHVLLPEAEVRRVIAAVRRINALPEKWQHGAPAPMAGGAGLVVEAVDWADNADARTLVYCAETLRRALK